MATFPDDLPPAGVDLLYKLLIYFVILYVITTAITTWLVTRRRSFPKKEIVKEARAEQVPSSIQFADTGDHFAHLQVKIQASEAAMNKLNELKNFQSISASAYRKLNDFYSDELSEIKAEIDTLETVEEPELEVSQSGVSDQDMNVIEADLEKQLLDLEEDDAFLKSRPKRSMDEIFNDAPATPPATPVQSTPAPAPTPPPAKQQVSTPPPAKTTPIAAKSSTAAPPPPSTKKPVQMPPSPSSSSKSMAPPPPGKVTATPPLQTPPKPAASQPLTAAQPIKVKSDEEDEGVFAKSTSIAALRMDMLRELARLKKLIPEDQQDQE